MKILHFVNCNLNKKKKVKLTISRATIPTKQSWTEAQSRVCGRLYPKLEYRASLLG